MFEKIAFASRLWQAALELVYPPLCAACDASLEQRDAVFCGACALTLVAVDDAACPRCARPTGAPGPAPPWPTRPPPCLGCLARPPRFSGARAAFAFGGALATAVRRLKWQHLPELAPPLGALLDASLARAPPPWGDIDLVVPVPLHRKRLRAREFNQAALLATALVEAARARQAPLGRAPIGARVLERVRDTPPQTGLDARERRKNVLGAFAVCKPERVRGRQVLLVDDVMTTGATADACAAALLGAGAAAVLVLTLGRAVT